MSSLSNIKAVLIGCGRMGLSHAESCINLGIKIVGICDSFEKNLSVAAQKLSISNDNCFLSANEMFDKIPRPDLTLIATTADTHCHLTCLAAQAKSKYILCEKPMATSIEDANKMISFCEKNGSILAINHQMRFMPQYTMVKKTIKSLALGPLSSMNVIGGCMGVAMNGSHYIEAFRYLCDTPPSSICAWFTNTKLSNPRGDNFFDAAGQVKITSNNSKRMYMDISEDQGHGMTCTYATQYGHILADELGGKISYTARKKEHMVQPNTRYGMPVNTWTDTFTLDDNISSTQKVIQALIEENNYPDAQVGKMVVLTLACAYKSNSLGSVEVEVSEKSIDDTFKFNWA